MNNTILFITAMSVSQAVYLFFVILLSNNSGKIKILSVLLVLGFSSYALSLNALTGAFQFGTIATFLCYVLPSIIQSITLAMIWLVIEDRPLIPSWLYTLLAADVLFETFVISTALFHAPLTFLFFISSAKQLLLVGISIYIILRGRKNDLIEMRLKVRIYILITLILFVIPILVTAFTNGKPLNPDIALLLSIQLFLLCLLVNIALLKFNPKANLQGDVIKDIVKLEHQDPALTKILDTMKQGKLYEDHELRIANFAAMVNISEVQLRKKINHGLGFRNFNQFVNTFRIEDAKSRLIENPDLPILTIAMDVGFKSISSFNTGFRAQTGLSPTDYRQQTTKSQQV